VAVRVSAIIPAFNEADVIAETIRVALGIPGVSEVVVVDDGSSDRTAEVARSAGAHRVIVLPRNLGKGEALNQAVRAVEADVLLLLDGDLGASAGEGLKLLDPVLRGDADMTIAVFSGSREAQVTGDAVTLAARSGGFGMVVKTARLGIRLLAGRQMQAPLAGPRALKCEIIEKAGGFAPRFGAEVGLTIDALRMRYRVVEVPVGMVHRASGRNLKGFAHRGRQMVDVLRTLGRKALTR